MTERYDIPISYPNNFTKHTAKTERKISDERLNNWSHELMEQYARYEYAADRVIRAGDSLVVSTRGSDGRSMDVYICRDYAHTNIRHDETGDWRVEVEENGQ